MRILGRRLLFLMFAVLPGLASGAEEFNLPVSYDTLPNGLRVIVVQDTTVAVVSCRLYYFVGSIYDGLGQTGISHMYEHMMFKGTKVLGTSNYTAEKPFIDSLDKMEARLDLLRQQSIPDSSGEYDPIRKQIDRLLTAQRKYIKKDEIWDLYLSNGGTELNAWTGDEITGYTVTLPQNKVELFFWIESDRMQNIVLREFASERDVVAEERRMRYDNRPQRKYLEQLYAHFYLAHPYRNPTIGWMSDIQAYTRKKLERHIKEFYTPDNALLVLVGNVKQNQAMNLVHKYFSTIPRAKSPKEEIVTREPAPYGKTQFIVYDNAQPRIDLLFPIPGYPHKDLYTLTVLESILSGESGRLYRRLVNIENLCVSVDANSGLSLHNGYFSITASLKPETSPEKVIAIMIDELDKLKKSPPADWEMERNKNQLRMSFVNRLTSLEGISDELAYFERLHSWKDMIEYPERIKSVTTSMIPSIVSTYFLPDRMTVGMFLDKKMRDSSSQGGAEK